MLETFLGLHWINSSVKGEPDGFEWLSAAILHLALCVLQDGERVLLAHQLLASPSAARSRRIKFCQMHQWLQLTEAGASKAYNKYMGSMLPFGTQHSPWTGAAWLVFLWRKWGPGRYLHQLGGSLGSWIKSILDAHRRLFMLSSFFFFFFNAFLVNLRNYL